MADEREMQGKATEFRMLQERGAAMQAQINALKGLLDEAGSASKALAAISSPDANESVLFPLGAGVMAKAKLLSQAKVLTEEGAGVVLERSVEDCLKQLEERKAKLSQALVSYDAELNKLLERLEMLRSELVRYQ